MHRATKIIVYLVLISLCLFLAFVALNPPLRKQAQDYVFPKTRMVLSSAWGKFGEDQIKMKAVKSRDARGVFVEVFSGEEDGELALVTTILTGDPHDGQFNFKGRMSRLVAADVDQDGQDELLIPTFDPAMRPNLGVYKYQPDKKEFQKITSDF